MLNDPAHPLWKLLRLVVLLVACMVTFHFGYQSGLVYKDIIPIITLLLTIGGFDIAKAVVTKHE